MTPERLTRWALRLEVEELYADYCSCLDGQRFEQWPEFFTDDCIYTLTPRENHDAGLPLATMAFESKAMLKDRVYGITQTMFHAPYYQRHIMSAIRIVDSNERSVRVEANYLVLRTKRDQPSELFNAGRCLDLIARTPEGLRFAEKRCVFDSEVIPNSIIYPI